MRKFMVEHRGHLKDLYCITRKGVARKIGTYNCKTNVLTLYNATDNDLLSEQVFFRAGLEQIREEYNNE